MQDFFFRCSFHLQDPSEPDAGSGQPRATELLIDITSHHSCGSVKRRRAERLLGSKSAPAKSLNAFKLFMFGRVPELVGLCHREISTPAVKKLFFALWMMVFVFLCIYSFSWSFIKYNEDADLWTSACFLIKNQLHRRHWAQWNLHAARREHSKCYLQSCCPNGVITWKWSSGECCGPVRAVIATILLSTAGSAPLWWSVERPV